MEYQGGDYLYVCSQWLCMCIYVYICMHYLNNIFEYIQYVLKYVLKYICMFDMEGWVWEVYDICVLCMMFMYDD